MKDIYKKIAQDVKVDLLDEFDRNFERKGFFDQAWPATKRVNPRGSLMMRTGKLRRGLNATVKGESIVFKNSMPYASLQNEGGTITVTTKMKKFFWAMYYKSGGAAAKARGERKAVLTEEASGWRALALKKVGSKMKIPQRRFVGDHPMVKKSIKRVMDIRMKEVEMEINRRLRRR